MYDATSPFEAGRFEAGTADLQRSRGAAAISFARRHGRTVMTELHQEAPCRVLFPEPEPGEPPLAVLLTMSGGLTGGDSIRVGITVGEGASVCFSTQAAEKIYRSLGPDVAVDVELSVASGARLEYLPQETILFEGARLRRTTAADIADGGSLAATEMLVFGRRASGEVFSKGRVWDGWRVRHGGRLAWVDRLALDGDIGATLADPFKFDGAAAIATALHAGHDSARLLPDARELADGAATIVNGILVARLIGPSAREVRERLGRYLIGLRGAIGLPPRLPRVWHL
jgi:urease accessory protein